MTCLACHPSGQMVADVIILWRRRCTWLATVLHRFNSIFMAPPPSADVLRPAHRNAILCPFTAEIVAHFADDWINFPATKSPDLIAIFGELLARCNCCVVCLWMFWQRLEQYPQWEHLRVHHSNNWRSTEAEKVPIVCCCPLFFCCRQFLWFSMNHVVDWQSPASFLSTVKVEGNGRPRRSSYLFTSACNHRHQPRRWIAKG